MRTLGLTILATSYMQSLTCTRSWTGHHPIARDRHLGLKDSLLLWLTSKRTKEETDKRYHTRHTTESRLSAAALPVARSLSKTSFMSYTPDT